MNRPQPWENKQFELLCRDYIAWEYPQYPHFTLYGMNGARQFGCDVMSQDRTLIIQCKCYNIDNPKAYELLVNAIAKDYSDACNHFPCMERFVVCTTLDNNRNAQDQVFSLRKDVPIDLWFWSDIEKIPGGALKANSEYSNDFEAPLFLHVGNPLVCVKNLYVANSFRVFRVKENDSIDYGNYQAAFCSMADLNRRSAQIQEGFTPDPIEACSDIWEQLSWFISEATEELLLIEGDAGCGKTSLVQALCWHDQEGDGIGEKLLGGRQLLTVRLRDLDRTTVAKEKGILSAILDYLQIPGKQLNERKKILLKRFPKAVLLLDGFDELCIIDGVTNNEQLLSKLTRERLYGWKIIVTSRPNYILKRINCPFIVLVLEHFGKKERINWINNYSDVSKCNQKISPQLENYIIEGMEEGVCDTPLSLYLLSAGNLDVGDTKNLWHLYRRLFHSEIAIRPYDKDEHPDTDFLNYIYRLPGEVAHKIYCLGYSKPWISEIDLVSLASNINSTPPDKYDSLPFWNSQKDFLNHASHCVALCCYWKISEDRGYIEFYHNNIRDFFLCEKIFEELNRLYKDNIQREEKAKTIAYWFRDNFRTGPFPEKVCEFLWLRAKYDKQNNIFEFPRNEKEQQLLPLIFEQLLTDGTIFDGMNEKYLLPVISSVLCCVARVYRAVLEPFRNCDELIIWWNNVDEVNRAGLFKHFVNDIFGKNLGGPSWCNPGSYGFFRSIILRGILLPNTDLHGSDFCKADFADADLHNSYLPTCNLSGANLHGANLERAVLRRASLIGSDLQIANLQYANLQRAELTNSKLNNSIISAADLQFASLDGADLTFSDLRNSDCWKASFNGAILNTTKIDGADFTGVDFSSSDFSKAVPGE